MLLIAHLALESKQINARDVILDYFYKEEIVLNVIRLAKHAAVLLFALVAWKLNI